MALEPLDVDELEELFGDMLGRTKPGPLPEITVRALDSLRGHYGWGEDVRDMPGRAPQPSPEVPRGDWTDVPGQLVAEAFAGKLQPWSGDRAVLSQERLARISAWGALYAWRRGHAVNDGFEAELVRGLESVAAGQGWQAKVRLRQTVSVLDTYHGQEGVDGPVLTDLDAGGEEGQSYVLGESRWVIEGDEALATSATPPLAGGKILADCETFAELAETAVLSEIWQAAATLGQGKELTQRVGNESLLAIYLIEGLPAAVDYVLALDELVREELIQEMTQSLDQPSPPSGPHAPDLGW